MLHWCCASNSIACKRDHFDLPGSLQSLSQTSSGLWDLESAVILERGRLCAFLLASMLSWNVADAPCSTA